MPFPQTSSLSLPYLSLCIILANKLITYFMKRILSYLVGVPSLSNRHPRVSASILFPLQLLRLRTFPSSYLSPMPLSVLRSLPLLLFQEFTLLVFPSVRGRFGPHSQLDHFLQAFRHFLLKRKQKTAKQKPNLLLTPYSLFPSSWPTFLKELPTLTTFFSISS